MSGAEAYGVPADPLIGQVIQERYKIAHAIGRGAMGVVYEAQHLLIGRKVALKTMAAHSVSSAGVQRFRREAQAAAAVGSSHVVDVLDMGRLENGSFYIVMEHLAGVDLGFAVALDQRFSVGRAIHVLVQLCDALSAIHAAGIIHRDLKPENIFLTTRDGTADFVKVLDFGVCRFNDAEGGRLTATGDTIGTPLFMAPEQVQGRADCDHRADIYALGAILHFVLTGRAPFDGPSLPALFMRICHEPAPSLATTDTSLSLALDAIVLRALSKDPNARFSSCGAFKAALRSIQATPDEVAATLPSAAPDSRVTEYIWDNVRDRSTGAIVRSQRIRRARWFGVVVGGVAAFTILASLGAYFVRAHGVEPQPQQIGARVLTSRLEASLPAPPVAPSAFVFTDRELLTAGESSAAVAAVFVPHHVTQARPVRLPLPPAAASSVSPAITPAEPEPAASVAAPPASASPSASVLHFSQGPKRGL